MLDCSVEHIESDSENVVRNVRILIVTSRRIRSSVADQQVNMSLVEM